jgi:ATP-dependent DNA helicase RecG
MKRTLIQNSLPEPILETDKQCTYFLTVLSVHPEWHPDNMSKQSNQVESIDKNKDKIDSTQASNQVDNQANAVFIKVLNYCKKPRSKSEILHHLELSVQTKNYKRYIEPALENAWIERTIPEKPTSSNQKYVITEKGLMMLNQLTKRS